MNKIKRVVTAAVAAIGSLVPAQAALAVPTTWPWANQSLETIAATFIRWVMTLGVLIAVGVLVFGGISYMTSGGDKMKVQQSQSTMTAAIVGLLIVLGAYLVIKTICSVGDLGTGPNSFCGSI